MAVRLRVVGGCVSPVRLLKASNMRAELAGLGFGLHPRSSGFQETIEAHPARIFPGQQDKLHVDSHLLAANPSLIDNGFG